MGPGAIDCPAVSLNGLPSGQSSARGQLQGRREVALSSGPAMKADLAVNNHCAFKLSKLLSL